MARTKAEILEEILARKDADPILSNICTSQSKQSFFLALFACYAEITGEFELTFDDFLSEVKTILESKQVHTSFWWRSISLGFQLGDPLVTFVNGNLGYEVIDVDKQIIKRAAVFTDANGRIELKVAELSGGLPVSLTPTNLSAFLDYINDMQPAGLDILITTLDGDEIRVGFTVTVDSQIINISDGTLLSDGTTKPVENAVNDYIAGFQNVSFGGTFYANKLMQSVLNTDGVLNSVFTFLEKKASGESGFVDVLSLPSKSFKALSGYVNLESGFILSDNINYITG